MDLLTLHINVDQSTGHKVVNSRYELLQSLGQGQFGKVLLARDKSVTPAKYYAIKTINRIDTSRLITKTYMSHTTKIKREIRIMKECDHPNVVKLFSVIDDMKYDKILLVLEYCQFGEIDWKKYNHYHEKYLKDGSKSLPLNKVLRDVANGLEYLHLFKHIIHRDLKPSNLLISRDRTIKISDFGVSLILENNANDDKELGKTMGTPAFFAPELCQFVNKRLLMLNDKDLLESKIDARIDIWSLGVVLYCLFYHRLPFEGHNEFSLFKNIVNGPIKFPRAVESAKSRPQDSKELEYLVDLLKKLLSKDPSQRPTLQEIKAHPFTVFGLLKAEIDRYNNINKLIFISQGPSNALDIDNSLSGKLRRLFVGKTTEITTASGPSPIVKVPTSDKEIIYQDLEKVDDLLDSYLDDSSSLSSMGSLEDPENGAEQVDTSNLLSSIENATSAVSDYLEPTSSSLVLHLSSFNQGLVRETASSVDSVHSSTSSFKASSPIRLDAISNKSISPTKLRNILSGQDMSRSVSGLKFNVPSPLQLNESNFQDKSRSNVLVYDSKEFDSKSIPISGPRTPSSGGSTVIIGPSSPLSLKSIFSPSRRFFAKIKKEKKEEATIGSLASSSRSEGFLDLDPPPTVGGHPRIQTNRRDLTSSVDSGPWKGRKNSMSSMGLNVLSKLSSSSSSLNLHAYLIDEDGEASHSVSDKDDDSRGVVPDFRNGTSSSSSNKNHHFRAPETEYRGPTKTETCDEGLDNTVLTDDTDDADRTFSMDEYLDRL